MSEDNKQLNQTPLRVGEFMELKGNLPIPKWLEDYDGKVTALTDAIILRRENGFEIRPKDPNYTDAVLFVEGCTFLEGQGGGVDLVSPAGLAFQLDKLKSENERLKADLGAFSFSPIVSALRDAVNDAKENGRDMTAHWLGEAERALESATFKTDRNVK